MHTIPADHLSGCTIVNWCGKHLIGIAEDGRVWKTRENKAKWRPVGTEHRLQKGWAATVFDEKLINYGQDGLYVFSLESGHTDWIKVKIMGHPVPLRDHAITAGPDGIIFTGGLSPEGFNTRSYLLPYNGDPWQVLNFPPIQLTHHCMSIHGLVLNIFGGFTSTGDASHEVTSVPLDGGEPAVMTHDPPPLGYGSLVMYKSNLYSLGITKIYRWVDSESEWEDLDPAAPSVMTEPSMVVMNETSGAAVVSRDLKVITRYDLEKGVRLGGLVPQPPAAEQSRRRRVRTQPGVLPSVKKKVVEQTLKGLSSQSKVKAAVETASSGVLDLRNCDLQCGDLYILAMCVSCSKICHIRLGGNPTLPRVAAQTLLNILQTNSSITSLDFGTTAVESPVISKLIQQQLSLNAVKSDHKTAARVNKKRRQEIRKQLTKDRSLREWKWARYSDRLRVEEAWGVGVFLNEAEWGRDVIVLGWGEVFDRLKVSEMFGLSVVEATVKLREDLLQERVDFMTQEEPARQSIETQQERNWDNLERGRYESKRDTEALLKERARRERAHRDDVCIAEKQDRTKLKDTEITTVLEMVKHFKMVYAKLEQAWRKCLHDKAETERKKREEKLQREREEARRLEMQERWEEQKKKAQADLYKKENSVRFTIGSVAQDERTELANFEVRERAKHLQYEREGKARRELAKLNWIPPMLSVTNVADCKSYVGSVSPTTCISQIIVECETPVPSHLEQGLQYPCDTEDLEQYLARKSEILSGVARVYLSNTYYHPSCVVSFIPDIEDSTKAMQFGNDQPNTIVVGKTQIAVIQQELTAADIQGIENPFCDNDEGPDFIHTDTSTRGLEIFFEEGTKLQDYQGVLSRIGVLCERQTPLQEKLPLSISLEINFSAPLPREDDGDREWPSSLRGSVITSMLEQDVRISVLLSPFIIPTACKKYCFAEGSMALKIFKGTVVRIAPESFSITILRAGEMDVLSSKGVGKNNPLKIIKKTNSVIEISVDKQATASQVTTFIESISFENCSEDPEPHDRTVQLVFKMKMDADHTSEAVYNSTISVIPEDDLTLVDFGCPSMPFRKHCGTLIDTLPDPTQPSLRFTQQSSVTDVDTNEFTSGYLVVKTGMWVKGDDILIEPSVDSLIKREGCNILHDGKIFGVLEGVEDHPEGLTVVFEAGHCPSIPKIDALLKCVVFTTTSGKEGVRVVWATLVVDQCEPVTTSCEVKVTGPLILIQPEHQSVTYREQSGHIKLGPFEFLAPDDGWDGGFVHVEISRGATPDDVLLISQGEFSVVEYSEDQAGSISPLIKPGLTVPASGVKLSLKDKLKAKIKEGITARNAAKIQMKKNILDEVRRRGLGKHGDVKEIRAAGGQRIGTFTQLDHGILVHLTTSLAIAQSESGSDIGRCETCSIRKQQVAALLRQVTYTNSGENPKPCRKVICITVNDGLPHSSCALIELNLQPRSDTIIVKRKSSDPLLFRQGQLSGVDIPLFQECFIPDLQFLPFTRGYMIVEPVSGGDCLGDQLGFLSKEHQELYFNRDKKILDAALGVGTGGTGLSAKKLGPNSPAIRRKIAMKSNSFYADANKFLGNIPEKRRLMAEDPSQRRYIQKLEAGGLAFEGVKFGTLIQDEMMNSSGISCLKIVFDEECEQSPAELLELCMWCVGYTNTSTKVKQSTITYQLRIVSDTRHSEGRLKIALTSLPPYLWAPEYSKSRSYTEGEGWVVVNQKITAFYSHIQEGGRFEAILRKGVGQDEIKWQFADTGFIHKNEILYHNKDLVGNTTTSPEQGLLRVDIPATSKISSKVVTALLKCLVFRSTDQVLTSESRQRYVDMSFIDMEDDPIKVTTGIYKTQAEEAIVSVCLNIKKQPVSVILSTGWHHICPDATVKHPNSHHFNPRTIRVYMRNMVPGDELGFKEGLGVSVCKETSELTVENRVVGMMTGDDGLEIVLGEPSYKEEVERILQAVAYQNKAQRERNTKRCVSIRIDSGETKVVQIDLMQAPILFASQSVKLSPSQNPAPLFPGLSCSVFDAPSATITITSSSPLFFSISTKYNLHIENSVVVSNGKNRIATVEATEPGSMKLVVTGAAKVCFEAKRGERGGGINATISTACNRNVRLAYLQLNLCVLFARGERRENR